MQTRGMARAGVKKPAIAKKSTRGRRRQATAPAGNSGSSHSLNRLFAPSMFAQPPAAAAAPARKNNAATMMRSPFNNQRITPGGSFSDLRSTVVKRGARRVKKLPSRLMSGRRNTFAGVGSLGNLWMSGFPSQTQALARRGSSVKHLTSPRPWTQKASMPGCKVSKLELLSGDSVSALTKRLDDLSPLCRGQVGPGYIKSLFKKKPQSAFAIVARDASGKIVGFTRNLVYKSFAGGGNAAAAPVTRRMVMLDLICTDKNCKGIGTALLRALIDISKHKLGAQLLMLEATKYAAGYYAKFGFRRVPNACDFPSDAALAAAQAAFRGRAWSEAELLKEAHPDLPSMMVSYRNAAEINRQLGGVWWQGFNSNYSDNGTVIMSLCLGRGGAPGSRAAWNAPAPYANKDTARVHDATRLVNIGRFVQ